MGYKSTIRQLSVMNSTAALRCSADKHAKAVFREFVLRAKKGIRVYTHGTRFWDKYHRSISSWVAATTAVQYTFIIVSDYAQSSVFYNTIKTLDNVNVRVVPTTHPVVSKLRESFWVADKKSYRVSSPDGESLASARFKAPKQCKNMRKCFDFLLQETAD